MKIIDLHTHGIEGFDTHSADPGVALEMARIQGAAGVDGIVLSVYSGSISRMRDEMAAIGMAMEKQAISGPSPAARILGIHLEGPFLNPSYAGALDAASFAAAESIIFEELIEGFAEQVRIVTIAPEIEGAVTLIRRVVSKGIKVNMGHSGATYAEAEAGFRAGAGGITHLFNAMRPFHHREPGIVGFALTNPDIYVELIADLFHVHPKGLELAFHAKGPDRTILVSDSVKETTSSAPGAVRDGRSRLIGGSMTVTEAARKLIDTGFDRDVVMKAITENPGTYLQQ